MSAEYSVEEVREEAASFARVFNGRVCTMLTNCADLLERIKADESALSLDTSCGSDLDAIAGYTMRNGRSDNEFRRSLKAAGFTNPPAQAAQVDVPAHREWRSALTLAAETLEVEAEHMAEGGQDGEAIRMKRSSSIIRSMLGAPAAEPVAQGDHARDLRNLIYCSLQFDHRGETDLKHEELLALVNRGWLAEGEENNEFDVTDAGASIMKLVLHQPVMRAECAASKTDAVSDAIKLLRDLQSNIGPLRPDPDEEDERETWDKIDRVVERLAAQLRAVPDAPRTIYDQRVAVTRAVEASAPRLHVALKNLLDAVEERPDRMGIESVTIQEAHSAMLAAAPSPGEANTVAQGADR